MQWFVWWNEICYLKMTSVILTSFCHHFAAWRNDGCCSSIRNKYWRKGHFEAHQNTFWSEIWTHVALYCWQWFSSICHPRVKTFYFFLHWKNCDLFVQSVIEAVYWTASTHALLELYMLWSIGFLTFQCCKNKLWKFNNDSDNL